MAEDRFDINAFNRRVLSSLERRAALRETNRPPTLIERFRAVRKFGRKFTLRQRF